MRPDVSNPPFRPREIVLDLPAPPSVNGIWQHGRDGSVWLSKDYTGWHDQADRALMVTGQARGWKRIAGPFMAQIIVKRANRRRDLDNYVKPLLDYAQRRDIIKNDNGLSKLILEWGRPASDVRMILTDMEGGA